MPSTAPLRWLVAVATLGVLAACGDTTAEDATAADCGPDDGTTVVVEIPEFSFDPDPVVIDRCDEVEWLNAHDQPHTSTGDGDQRWNTGNVAPGERSEPVAFDQAGTYSYLCALHPFMTGTVEVS